MSSVGKVVRFFLLAVCARVIVSTPCFAQPLARGAVVLNVYSEQVIRSETEWKTSWGTFSKNYLNKRLLVINLRKLGPGDSSVTVKWYFIGRTAGPQGKMFIYDFGERTGSIAEGGVLIKPYSKELVFNREQTSSRGSQSSGAKPWGWAVFVEQNGNQLWETASIPELVPWTTENREKIKRSPSESIPEIAFEPVFPSQRGKRAK
jgi:hypothetical protein